MKSNLNTTRTLLVFVLLLLITCCNSLPFWKVFCSINPAFRGRIDPIVNPGVQSGHSHKVWGASNFDTGSPLSNTSSIDMYNQITNSRCTDCSITKDLSNYWIPDLYYQYPNGSLTLVPRGGLTVYYLSRGGTGNQTNPTMSAFPKGLRMLAGNPYRRNFTNSSIADRAISYACLAGATPGPGYEPNNFPTDRWLCENGLRAQVWFPMCWDGVNLDSSDHKKHMSYPLQRPDGGDCPSTHPKRVPGLFYEILFSIDNATFPHGPGIGNPFVWSSGDSTGYGLHGDFLNGWDLTTLSAALVDPTCDESNKNTSFGNNVRACKALAPYVVDPNENCVARPLPGFVEDLGLNHIISKLPGCNPVTGFNQAAAPCAPGTAQPNITVGTLRGYLKNIATGQYINVYDNTTAVSLLPVNSTANTISQIFVLSPISNNGSYAWTSERSGKYIGGVPGGNQFLNNKGSVSSWETWRVSGTGQSGVYSVWSQASGKYLTVGSGGLTSDAVSVGNNSLWRVEVPVIPLGNTTFTGMNFTSSPFA